MRSEVTTAASDTRAGAVAAGRGPEHVVAQPSAVQQPAGGHAHRVPEAARAHRQVRLRARDAAIERERRLEGRRAQAPGDRARPAADRLAERDPGVRAVELDVHLRRVGRAAGAALEGLQRGVLRQHGQRGAVDRGGRTRACGRPAAPRPTPRRRCRRRRPRRADARLRCPRCAPGRCRAAPARPSTRCRAGRRGRRRSAPTRRRRRRSRRCRSRGRPLPFPSRARPAASRRGAP